MSITNIMKSSEVGAESLEGGKREPLYIKSSFNENVVRPTVLLQRVKRLSAILTITSLNFDMDIERMMREEPLRNAFDKSVFSIGNMQLHKRTAGVSSPDSTSHDMDVIILIS